MGFSSFLCGVFTWSDLQYRSALSVGGETVKIISRRERRTVVSYTRGFSWDGQDDPHYGFGFDCDENGSIDESKLNPCAIKNLKACLTGEVDGKKIVDQGVQRYETTHTEPAVGECNRCGEEVVLYGFTNTCECGADYNMSGQELAPRSQWGEETGETYADIVAPGDPFDEY